MGPQASGEVIPRFVCDEQLGRLAKWLRLQGFDTIFKCPVENKELIRIAQSEKRFLLTRDSHLPAKTLWEGVVVIEESNYARQMTELRKKIHLPKGKSFSRCLDCNDLIQSVPRAKVEGRVPAEVAQNYDKFYTCPSCSKIFWKGSHVKNSEAALKRLK